MAWEHFATPVAAQFAQSYLASRRGIDRAALRAFSGGAPVGGYAETEWTALVSRLHYKGVISDDELLGTNHTNTHPRSTELQRSSHRP